MAGSILVTGAEGFVGSHLLTQLGDRATPSAADVTDADAIAQAVAGERPRGVVHLAAVSSAGASWSQAAETWRVNVLGTVNVLDAVREHAPAARVVVVSTGEVYGQADEIPTPESAPYRPVSPYAASKAAAELAADQARRAGLDVVVARPFQHEGPGRDERFAVGSWAAQIAQAEEAGGGTVRVGDLTPRRDLADVRDVCRAYDVLLDPEVPVDMYNVATGRVVEMREVLELLVSLARCPIEIEVDPARLRPSEIGILSGDARRLRAAGWAPAIPLEQTLGDTLDAARATVAEKMAST